MRERRSMGAMAREDAELSLLLDEGFAGAVSVEVARRLLAQLQEARRSLAKMNRRCQQAESIIAKSKVVENRPRHAQGRSFGRALANYAAAVAGRERDAWRACAVALRGALPEFGITPAERAAIAEFDRLAAEERAAGAGEMKGGA